MNFTAMITNNSILKVKIEDFEVQIDLLLKEKEPFISEWIKEAFRLYDKK